MADKRLFILAQPDFPKTKGFQLLTRFMQGHREIKVSFATRTAHLAAALATRECDLIFAAGLTNQAHAQPSETARVFLEWLQEQSGQ